MPFVYLLAFIFLIPAVPAFAATGFGFSGDSSPSRFGQRKLYQDLIYRIRINQRSKYKAREHELVDYPLYPYLEYADKIKRLSRQTDQSIRAFIEQYQDTPLATRMLKKYLDSLARKGAWQTFLDIYSETGKTDKNACYHAYALYKTNQKTLAMAEADRLWMVGESQPDACNAIFEVWRAEGNLTGEVAWQRFEMAITSGEVSLASYLIRFLSKQDRVLADNFKQAHRRPRTITQTSRFSRTDPKSQAAILHGLKRLARSDPVESINTLSNYLETHEFDVQALHAAYVYIAVRLARKPETAHALSQVTIDLTHNQELVEAQLLTALRQLNWSEALVYLQRLSAEAQQTERWQYWRARILSSSTNLSDWQIATGIYTSLASKRSFYGFLAADLVNRKYEYEIEPATISAEELASMESTPGIQRALELYTLKEHTNARREWNFTTRNFSVREFQIAARVMQKWGWHQQAIQAMTSARAWNDLELRFPIVFYDSFVNSARIADIPLDWSLAVARQESAFKPDARSPVGALGVMQLMMTTAKSTARREGLSKPTKRSLTIPSTNIRIGTAYLGKMLRRFDDNRVLATAAYNAGPFRVRSWRDDSLPVDVWVETIPFQETRKYVMNVLLFSTIYSRKLNRRSPMIYEHERKLFSTQHIDKRFGALKMRSCRSLKGNKCFSGG